MKDDIKALIAWIFILIGIGFFPGFAIGLAVGLGVGG